MAETGLEPVTFGLWAQRATYCSTPRFRSAKVYYFYHKWKSFSFLNKKKSFKQFSCSKDFCIHDWIWTSTSVRTLPPQSSTSTNSATWMFWNFGANIHSMKVFLQSFVKKMLCILKRCVVITLQNTFLAYINTDWFLF